MTNQEREIVLPGGGFAKMRRLTGRDLLEAQKDKTGKDIVFILMSRAITIDDAPLTYEQLLDMDLQDVMALHKEVNILLMGPVT